VILATGVFFCAWSTRLLVAPSSLLGLALAVGVAGIAYCVGCFLLWRTRGMGPLRLIPLVRRAAAPNVTIHA
jgi:hypothetical protein